MIVHIKEILKKKVKCAIGAFNTYNLESTLGILRAAKIKKTPVIIQISEATIKYAGLKTILAIIETAVEKEAKDIPIAVHLDHGKSFEIVSECIKEGLSSVHMDGSALPFKDNVSVTKKAVVFGHKHGAWVQGELGALPGKEGMTKVEVPKDGLYLTDPKEAEQFVKLTGVDTLAVSVGTMHGNFKGKEKVDLERVRQIGKRVKKPLVLHGASGITDLKLKQAIKAGISIINIDTDLRIAFTKTLKKTLHKELSFYDPRKILSPSALSLQKAVEKKISVFNSKK
ncbi:MAG: class II fructose-bisphosphate aldolase [Patescibacteria group bacterium]